MTVGYAPEEEPQPLAPAPVVAPVPAPVEVQPIEGPQALVQPQITDPANRRDQSMSRSTSRTVLSPEHRQHLAKEDKLVEAQVDTVRREAELAKERARIEEQLSTEEAARTAERQKAHEDLARAADERIAQRQAEYDQRYEEMKGFQFKDYWTSSGTNKVLATIGIGLGGALAGRNGGPNQVYAQLQQAMQMDFAKQKAGLDMMNDRVAMARTGIMDARAAREYLDEQLKLKQAAAKEAVAAKRAQLMAKLGVPAAEIAADQTVLKLQADAAADRGRLLEKTASEVRTEFTQRVSEMDKARVPHLSGPEAAATGDLRVLVGALATITNSKPMTGDKLAQIQNDTDKVLAAEKTASEGIGGTMLAGAARAVGMVPRNPMQGLSPEDQKQVLAWQQINMQLSKIYSGAGIGLEEQKRYNRQFMPSAGDSPEVVREKAIKAGEFVTKNLQRAGAGAPVVQRELDAAMAPLNRPQAAPRPATGGGRRVRLPSGETGTLSSDGTFTPDGK